MEPVSGPRKEINMTEDFGVILDYGGRPFTSGNRENAKLFFAALAHGYIHQGMGGGSSMSDQVQAACDLIALGFDPDMASSIGRETMDLRLHEWFAAWPQGKDRVRREAEFNRAVLQYDSGANCSCRDDEERRRLDRLVRNPWRGLTGAE